MRAMNESRPVVAAARRRDDQIATVVNCRDLLDAGLAVTIHEARKLSTGSIVAPGVGQADAMRYR